MSTQYVQICDGKIERGCVGGNPLWWFDQRFPHAFSLLDLDGFYPDPYYDNWEHAPKPIVQSLVARMIEMGKILFGRNELSVLELGCATFCWFSFQPPTTANHAKDLAVPESFYQRMAEYSPPTQTLGISWDELTQRQAAAQSRQGSGLGSGTNQVR